MNGAFAEVFGDLRPCVVRAEGFLVDVLLEDVARNIRVDLVVLAARRVVEVPGITLKEGEKICERLVGDGLSSAIAARRDAGGRDPPFRY